MKIKAFYGMKIDNAGEIYHFKNGKAKVPGFRINRGIVYITLHDFKDKIK